MIVDVEMPVACATGAMPPRPRARALVAAHTQRDRSVSVGARARYLAGTPEDPRIRVYDPIPLNHSLIV